MTPFFYSVHTQWPPFFHFCIKFNIKIANFARFARIFEKFDDFVGILTENLQILPWNCNFAHWMTPIFGSPHQKSPHFFGAHTEWPPFFDEILHWMPPIFVLRWALVRHFHIWVPPGALHHLGANLEVCTRVGSTLCESDPPGNQLYWSRADPRNFKGGIGSLFWPLC